MAVDMNVNNNVGNGTPQTQQKSKTSVDYQSFLKLLMAQMKNQDPTKPMDSTQYVAQLAPVFGVVAGGFADRPPADLRGRQDHGCGQGSAIGQRRPYRCAE